MKKNFFTLIILFFSIGVFGQNSSFGISLNSFNKEGENGMSINANVRVQLSNTLGWQTEVGYLHSLEGVTVIEERTVTNAGGTETVTTTSEDRDKAAIVKSGIAIKFLNHEGFSAEFIASGGAFRADRTIFGLISGELFLSSQIGKNLVVGIPISYNFITWERDDFTSVGVSLRFHM
ncbi:MAG: hypothetical protein P1U56_01300 [Saprospiraceae bacterium]|nr:hypothetical protein [Saprospiraceae bacterium]